MLTTDWLIIFVVDIYDVVAYVCQTFCVLSMYDTNVVFPQSALTSFKMTPLLAYSIPCSCSSSSVTTLVI